MSKHKDPLHEALEDGRSYTWTIPEGGDLASMRAAVQHGQTITMSPVADPREVEVGDIVFVRWHGGALFHLVGEKRKDEFLIVNSVGKVNGWVQGNDIMGRVTHIIDPPPRPDVPTLLDQLESHYRQMIAQSALQSDDAQRLMSVVADLHWYAERIGSANWDKMPRSNIWSFHQNLWRLTRRVEDAASSVELDYVRSSIDLGKACVGASAEIAIKLGLSTAGT